MARIIPGGCHEKKLGFLETANALPTFPFVKGEHLARQGDGAQQGRQNYLLGNIPGVVW